MSVSMLPTLNACLNSLAAILLVAGFVCIRNGKVKAHATCMISAFCVSVLFLISYLTHHFLTGIQYFPAASPWRYLYRTILTTHTILAIVIAPLAAGVLILALRGKFTTHRRWARWAFPIWLYVSITGVIVYWMLYRMGS